MHPQTIGKIVVGVDGAPRTIAALRWAASEALRRDAEIVAVHAWGSVLRPASYAPVTDCADPDENARQAADAAVRRGAARRSGPRRRCRCASSSTTGPWCRRC